MMAEECLHVLRIMADPANQVTSLSGRDKAAISGALALIERLRDAMPAKDFRCLVRNMRRMQKKFFTREWSNEFERHAIVQQSKRLERQVDEELESDGQLTMFGEG